MDELSLSSDALSALQEVMGGNINDSSNGEMAHLLSAMRRHNIDDSDSSSEDEDEDDGEQGETINHAEYYRKLFPERYTSQDDKNESELYVENPVALLTCEDDYVQDLLLKAFKRREHWNITTDKTKPYNLHWGEYEDIDWYSKEFDAESIMVSCYYNRKGLIRKGHLAHILEKWQTKYSDREPLAPKSYVLTIPLTDGENDETDETLQQNISASIQKANFPGFCESIEQNSRTPEKEKVWILKPSVTNQANGIVLVQSEKQLFDAIKRADEMQRAGDFVLQKYIEPLLLNGFKFHLRVFMLLHGNITAYVHPDFLSIFSLKKYQDASLDETQAHLTNISHQTVLTKEQEYACMRLLSETKQDMVDSKLVDTLEEAQEKIEYIQKRVYEILGETVEAVSSELTFQARNNCFELFGCDLMIDPDWKIWLLETNAEPDLSKAGDRLQCVIDQILEDTITTVIDNDEKRFKRKDHQLEKTKYVKVFHKTRTF